MKIFLTGFMGCGKSSIGRRLAKELRIGFTDMDEMIVQQSGMSIDEIFNVPGEPIFRQIEIEVLHQIIKSSGDQIVATGGGTPCFFDNMEIMNREGITLYLKLSEKLLYQRLRDETAHRPLLADNDDLKTYIITTLAEREKFYSMAQYIIKINPGDTDAVVCEKIQLILKNKPYGN